MKCLKDYATEISKCSKCGLCQSVCPVYKETLNDCAVSRGKFVMLDGVVKGNLKLNKTICKYLDLCLKCEKCSEFCPSSIDVCEIFSAAKYEYKKPFSLPLPKFNVKKNKKGSLKILYFKGCANNLFPKDENAMKKVLAHYDIELIEKNFDCCGLPYFADGDLERFEQCVNHNLSLLENENCEYVMTDCASCSHTLSRYIKDKKVINFAELIAQDPKKFVFKKPVKVTFHKPCHMDNIDSIKSILTNCKNIEYVKMEGFDECCGFAGKFALRHPKISSAIASKKAKNIEAAGVDYVLTLCPACVIGIKKAFFGKKSPKVMNLTEFLALGELAS